MNRRTHLKLTAALALAALPCLSAAQSPAQPSGHGAYPSRPIRLVVPFAKDSKVRALAVTTTTRVAAAPDLPTVSES